MIYKYPLVLQDAQTVQMPEGAVILTVQIQRETMCLWALVDENEPATEPRRFVIVGTGLEHPPAETLRYIGTVQTGSGLFVWHVFEETQ